MLSDIKFRSLIEQLPAITYVAEVGVGGRWLYVSPQVEQMLGFSVDEWLQRPDAWINQVHPDDRQEVRTKEKNCQEFHQPFYAEYRILTKAGQIIWICDEANFVTDETGTPILYQGIMLNVTDRKVIEDSLKQSQTELINSEESFKHLFLNNPLPMWVYELQTLRFLEVNDAAVAQYGYDRAEFLKMGIMDIRPESDHQDLLEDLSKERQSLQKSGPWRHRRKTGEIIDVEIASHTLNFEGHQAVLVVAQDITERKKVEAEKIKLEGKLMQVEKMHALGHLAGGVAHDFNNLLMAITGYCEIARMQLSEQALQDAKIPEIYDAARLGTSLTRQLLAFSRKQPLDAKMLNLNEIVRNIAPMLKRLIRQDVELCLHLPDDLGAIKADRTQVEQVILNLAVNARDALPNGGTLSIETANMELDANYLRSYPDVLPGNYVMLSLADNGRGMDKEIQQHIFEPFFTTKEAGKGTGLGLATVFGVVKQSAGHITVYSELEKGTTIRIYFPREFEPDQGIAITESFLPRRVDHMTVLLVDDNDMVRHTLAELLTLHNCIVLQAGDADKALKVLMEERNQIDVMITDMVMPKMSGVDLAEKARSLFPKLAVLYMSGYSQHMINFSEGSKTAFLTKPAPIQKILQKISDLTKADLS